MKKLNLRSRYRSRIYKERKDRKYKKKKIKRIRSKTKLRLHLVKTQHSNYYFMKKSIFHLLCIIL